MDDATRRLLESKGMPSQDKVKEMQDEGGEQKPAAEQKPAGEQKPNEQKPANTEQNKTPQSFDWSAVEEEQVFSHLTDKAGRDIKSWDDLKTGVVEKEVEKLVNVELPPEVDAINKYINDTGRGLSDFMKANKNWDEEKEDVAIREFLKVNNPHLDQEDINFLFEDSFKVPAKLEGDDYDDNEIAANDRAIRLANINRKQKATEARNYFKEEKAKYLDPIEDKKNQLQQQSEAGKEAWKEQANAALGSLEKIEHDGFSYSFKDKENLSESFSSIEGVLNRYKNDQGQLDHSKLFETLIKGEQIGSILEGYKSHVETALTQKNLRDKLNPGHIEIENEGKPGDKSAVEKATEELYAATGITKK